MPEGLGKKKSILLYRGIKYRKRQAGEDEEADEENQEEDSFNDNRNKNKSLAKQFEEHKLKQKKKEYAVCCYYQSLYYTNIFNLQLK